MPLLLSALPFHAWTDSTRNPPVQHWSIRLPMVVQEPGSVVPSATVSPQEWIFDTGIDGDAFAWRYHLENAGLDPDVNQTGSIRVISSLGASSQVPLRDAELWLISNVPNVAPYLLELDQGIAFRDLQRLPDPHLHRPLLGMKVFLRARLRFEVDFEKRTVSVWSPGT